MRITHNGEVIETESADKKLEKYLALVNIANIQDLTEEQIKIMLHACVDDFFKGSLNPDNLADICNTLYAQTNKLWKISNLLETFSELTYALRITDTKYLTEIMRNLKEFHNSK